MRYTDFLKLSEGFQYSINLQYDLGSNNKVKGYIPTINTVNILKSYLKAIYDGSGDKATVLVGPYGKGKSHLLLILLTLLQNKEENKDAIQELINKISRIDESTAQLCRMIFENNIKLLPVIINSNYTDLQQSFFMALNYSLKKNGLTDLMPNTYFDSVINVINKWKEEFEGTIKVLKKGLKDFGLTLSELEDRIKKYDQDSYEIFKDVYLSISSGIEFNPFVNSDVVRLYDETNFLLCDKYGYNGMFIVFDEFSKFMEASVSNNTIKDIKVLQDFAEISGRTSSKQQLHLACITHKTINEYVSKLPRDIINAWRGIEGRFKELYLISSSKQNYDLISSTIIKNEARLREYLSKNSLYKRISNSYELFKETYSEEEFKEWIEVGCFPLNPISTFALPKISEKVAQNERTLFTFLCKNEIHTLTDFINKNSGKFQLLNLDMIFDYFENLFKKEVFNEAVHDIWLRTDVAIRKCHSIDEKKVLKALAIIYIINEFEKLSPTKDILASALEYTEDKLNIILNQMIESNIVYIKRSNGYINFSPIAQANIREKIELIKNTKIKNINVPQELEKVFNLGFILPKRYNDDYKMIRFFKNFYVTLNQLEAFEDIKSIFEYYESDGVIANLIYFDEEEKQRAIDKIAELNNGRIVLCVPTKPFDKLDTVKEYIAIESLKNDKNILSDEPLAEQLIEVIEEDVIEDIKEYLEKYFIPENRNCNYYIYGKQNSISRKSDLNKQISDICVKHFYKTPKINNEMINKNNITTVIAKARQKVVEYIINSYNDKSVESLGGRGPEATIYRVTIANFRLGDTTVSSDSDLNNVLQIIREFIVSCEEKKKSFGELYDILLGEDIGMRKGVIPIYLSYVLREFKEELILSFGSRGNKEVDFTYDTLNNINEKPREYYIKIEKGTKEKEDYINSLIKLFDKQISEKILKTNRFTALGNAMQSYLQSLSQYSRTHRVDITGKELDSSIINYRSELLKFDLNNRDFLFNKLLKLTKSNDYYECLESIGNIKNYLDSSIVNLIGYLIKKTNNIINPSYKGSLTQNLKRWYIDLDADKKNHLYDVTTNSILKFINDLDSNDDIYCINKLASIVTGLNVEDWQEYTIELYFKNLRHSINVVTELDIDFSDDSQSLFKIEINQSGDVVEKSFEEESVSEVGVTLMNELEELLDEYGDAIEANEKRNILMKLLQRYM
ncbi:hypothetical protein CPJCM30710_15020 [Clostridium polyendosporum]|uniref:DUF6079 domain-containing protein n=1 Tax=Clostridium polyendosporum TaxID=69208 RepID=A0A919RYT2_9CLOT|nr:hypothetical protein [Clostridium polyendosporum]GIM28836.1 hypothetical protein CPJCM30710_15020 [Clostridium polyendosporum]